MYGVLLLVRQTSVVRCSASGVTVNRNGVICDMYHEGNIRCRTIVLAYRVCRSPWKARRVGRGRCGVNSLHTDVVDSLRTDTVSGSDLSMKNPDCPHVTW